MVLRESAISMSHDTVLLRHAPISVVTSHRTNWRLAAAGGLLYITRTCHRWQTEIDDAHQHHQGRPPSLLTGVTIATRQALRHIQSAFLPPDMPLLEEPGSLRYLVEMGEMLNSSGSPNRTWSPGEKFSSLEDIDVSGDGSLVLRIFISVVYSVVCAVGLVGNLLVFFLMRLRQGRKKSSINFFIINLAVTDFQFVLTLPFWAVDTALDFSWPFGDAMCKIILSVTVMNMYASVFFLTAMSVSRYWSVASAVKNRVGRRSLPVKWVCVVLWVSATVATAPTTIFSTVIDVAGETLCLLKFPDGHDWLALYHIQKILVAFVIPLLTVSCSYLMLLRFIRQRSMHNTPNPKRRSRVTRSVTVVVLSFFLCWMPNHVMTFWGVLVKFNAVNWDKTYYMVHTYVFPITICLAHANSSLNPVLYCLIRREFRKMLRDMFWRSPAAATRKAYPARSTQSGTPYDKTQGVLAIQSLDNNQCRLSIIDQKGSSASSVIPHI